MVGSMAEACAFVSLSLLVLQRENAVDYHLHEFAKAPRSNRQDKTPQKMPGTHRCQFASAPEPLRRLRF